MNQQSGSRASSQYNRMTEAQQKTIGQDYLRAIDQLRQKYQAVNQEVQQMNRNLQQTPSTPNGGGLLSDLGGKFGGALQVFGGNMLTKGAGMLAGLSSEMGDMVKQGVELARQGEGIRIAFERLGRGDILDGLRQATHGTVTDIELMKAAVKFNDFKLPVEELGTMLAFAQQKAKDTGQSVDYMVDSIVTGLGRKSLMILDNLGLSASEIKDKMAETGDMTKAVGAIIREQMAKAGDYVETAADRAAQANVSLQNKMEELGRKFAPVEEASNQLWTSMKIGILDVIGGPLARLLNGLTEAGRMKNALSRMNGGDNGEDTVVGRQLQNIRTLQKQGYGRNSIQAAVNSRVEKYDQQIDALQKQIDAANEARKTNIGGVSGAQGLNDATNDLIAQRDALRAMRDEYRRGANELLAPVTVKIDTKEAKQDVDSLRVKLAELEAQRKKAIAAGDTELSKNLAKQITQTKADIKGLGGTTTTPKATPKTEEQLNAARIAELVKQYQDLATAAKTADDAQKAGLTERMTKIQAEIKILQDRNTKLKKFADEARQIFPEGSLKSLQTEMASLQNAQQLVTNPSEWQDYKDAIKKATNQIKELKGELSDIDAGNMTSLGKIEGVSLADIAAGRVKGKGMKDLGLGDVPTRESIIAKGQKQIQGFDGIEPQAKEDKTLENMQKLTSGLSSVTSGLQQMGIELPDGVQKVLGGMQGLMSVIQGVQTIISLFSTTTATAQIAATTGNTALLTANTTALGALATAISFNSATNMIPFFSGGGIVPKAANGIVVPGNSFSGDRLRMPILDGGGMIGVNSGEVILNRAQASNLQAQLEGGGMAGGGVMQPYVDGEKIFLGMNNTSKRMGRGEIVTTSTLRRLGLI